MKKLGHIGLLLILMTGVAFAENGKKSSPYAAVYSYTSGGDEIVVLTGQTNIVDHNPGASGSYVRLHNYSSYIFYSVYDIDTGKYGGCFITNSSVYYESAQKALELSVSNRGIGLYASYKPTTAQCESFIFNYSSNYAS